MADVRLRRLGRRRALAGRIVLIVGVARSVIAILMAFVIPIRQFATGPAQPGNAEEVPIMSDSKSNWDEVGSRLEALALKLKLHLEQAGDGGDTMAKLREGVEGAFEAAGKVVKDEAVRSDVREVGHLLADAVSSTLTKVSEDVRDAVKRKP